MIAHYSRQFFGLILIAAGFVSIFDWGRYFLLADLWTSLQAIGFGIFLIAERKPNSDERKHFHKSTIVIAFFSVTVLIWRHLSSGLWLDELSQYFFVDMAAYQLPFSRAAATQQQPTLDMYFQLVSMKMFGAGEVVIRFFPAIFFIIAVIQIWDLIRRKSGSVEFALLGTTLFLSQPNIQYFSLEGRPYILAILTLILYASAFIDLLKANEPSTRQVWFLAMCGGVMASAIGFQPPLILSSTYLILAISKKSLRNKKGFYLSMGYIVLAVALIYKPILIDSIHIEKISLGHSFGDRDYLEILKRIWLGVTGGAYSTLYQATLVALSLAALVLAFVRFVRKAENASSEVSLLSVVLIISILTSLCFRYIINWPFVEKFSILSNVLLIIFVCLILGIALDRFIARLKPRAALTLIAITYCTFFFISNFILKADFSSFERENWRTFKEVVNKKKPVTIAPLSLLDHIMPPIFSIYGHKIYFPDDKMVSTIELKPSKINGRNVFKITNKLESISLLLAMPKIWSQDDLDENVIEALNIGEYSESDGFRYWYTSGNREEIAKFMGGILWIYAGQPWTFSLLETMLVYYSSKDNQQMIKATESQLWELLETTGENRRLGVQRIQDFNRESYLRYFSELKGYVH